MHVKLYFRAEITLQTSIKIFFIGSEKHLNPCNMVDGGWKMKEFCPNFCAFERMGKLAQKIFLCNKNRPTSRTFAYIYLWVLGDMYTWGSNYTLELFRKKDQDLSLWKSKILTIFGKNFFFLNSFLRIKIGQNSSIHLWKKIKNFNFHIKTWRNYTPKHQFFQ